MAQTLEKLNPNTDGEINELKADIAALRGDFEKLMRDASSVASSKADSAMKKGRNLMDDAGEQLKTQKSRVEGTVRDHPFAALGIAFGVGMLLAAVSRR